MNKYILTILSVAFISGCVFKPNEDLGFAVAKNLAQFEGCYANCSDSSDGSSPTCLSYRIWPRVFDIGSEPDEIYVEKKNNSELTISAFKLGNEVVKSSFKEGEHFTFTKGRIELKRKYGISDITEPGEVFLGFGTRKTIFGIDAKGEGRVEKSESVAGTAFIIFPIVAFGASISKIKRKGASCNER